MDEVGRQPDEERIQHLLVALERRTVIGQATGIVMERFKLDADAAFGVLRRVSSQRNRKVIDIAEELVATGRAEGL